MGKRYRRLSNGVINKLYFKTQKLEILLLLDRTQGYEDDVNGDTLHLKNIFNNSLFTLNSRSVFAETFYELEYEDEKNVLKKIFNGE